MYSGCRSLLIITFLGVCLSDDCLALRDVRIKVPTAVVRGKDVELQCFFDLDGERLYSVKWYRGLHEFFRYTPKDKEQFKVFDKGGIIQVRQNQSTERVVVLENVSREISGPFSCEVTAEKPSFFTAIQTAELQVVDIPKNNPHITGLKKRYTLQDEFFQANCTSADSYPAANITWYINGLQMRGPQIIRRHTINRGKLLTVTSAIRHRLTKKLFVNNRMKVRCSASIYDVYHQSTEVSVELIEKRRKHHQIEWPPTTLAPPLFVDQTEFGDEYENSLESPIETTLWFWPSTSFACNISYSAPFVIASLLPFIAMAFLR